jgi:gamma-glutamylcyclotransferase (GGCT)/AIG2-like uncharacterized protein YtfP
MEYIFVYGLFRDTSKSILGKAIHCGKASVKGTIWKVNEFYPGWKPEGNGKVWGDVFLIDPVNLPKMDEYEGDEYQRVKVRTSTDVECWIYQYINDVDHFQEIKCGDWLLR